MNSLLGTVFISLNVNLLHSVFVYINLKCVPQIYFTLKTVKIIETILMKL